MTRSNIPGDLRGPNGVTERAPPFVMAIGGAASRRSPCSVLRLTGRIPTPAHSSCTASDAIFPCPTTFTGSGTVIDGRVLAHRELPINGTTGTGKPACSARYWDASLRSDGESRAALLDLFEQGAGVALI